MFKRFTVGFAAGYVLGARAGRDRYDQIAQLAQRVTDTPLVGNVADSGREFASGGGRRVVETLRERLPAVASLWAPGDAESSGSDQEEPEDEAFDEDDVEDERDDEYEDRGSRSRSDDSANDGGTRGRGASRSKRATKSGSSRSARPAKRRPASRASSSKPADSGSRKRLSAVVSAARERGKVD